MVNKRVVVKGAGDLATGVGYRLFQAGFQVVMTEIGQPTVVRRKVAFAEAVYQGQITVEGVTAQLAESTADVFKLWEQKLIPVIIDSQAAIIQEIKPYFVVDAIIAKKNLGTSKNDAPFVIGIGPGFTAGQDVHAVVESNRGPNLGQVYYQGSAEPNTGIPGKVLDYTTERVLRAPAKGFFSTSKKIGDIVEAGDIIGYIIPNIPVKTQISGIVRGLLKNGLMVDKGIKLGDIEPRGIKSYCYTISDKAQTIGEAVLKVCESKLNTI